MKQQRTNTEQPCESCDSGFNTVAHPHGTDTPKEPVITQELLRRTQESLDRMYFAQKEYEENRSEVLALHDEGADLECGDFTMTVKPREVRLIKQKLVADEFGQAALDALLVKAEKQNQRVLRISRPSNASHQQNTQQQAPSTDAVLPEVKAEIVVNIGVQTRPLDRNRSGF